MRCILVLLKMSNLPMWGVKIFHQKALHHQPEELPPRMGSQAELLVIYVKLLRVTFLCRELSVACVDGYEGYGSYLPVQGVKSFILSSFTVQVELPPCAGSQD